ncbi:hypothetical protein ACFQ0O_28520 [Saccharopolyspora spinosporotrichia]
MKGRTAVRSSPASAFRALRYPDYRRWATADFVSVTGAWMQNLGLNWFVLTKTGSPGLLGLSFCSRHFRACCSPRGRARWPTGGPRSGCCT